MMKSAPLALCLSLVVSACVKPSNEATLPPAAEAPALPLDAVAHPEMVEVRTSLIPGAGKGLFAKVDIPEGTYLGPYTGKLLTPEQVDALEGRAPEYLFQVPECAGLPQYDAILGDMEHYVSKTNYAPTTINGRPTHLQSVDFDIECTPPYARLYTTRDVVANEELYADYGEDYDYFFMDLPEVQAYFLKVTGIPRRDTFTWDFSE